MLYLERKIGEAFMVSDNIKITLLEGNKGQQSRIGIEAPRDIPVHREEVYKRILDEEYNT